MPGRDPSSLVLSRLDSTSEWMRAGGPSANVALTCRARLARNLADARFVHRCSVSELHTVARRVEQAIAASPAFAGFELVALEDLTPLERHALVDRYLCSREFIRHPAGRLLLLHPTGAISVMVNEEDHLRIQCLYSGLQLETALKVCIEVEAALASRLEFAFSEQWGYLTACPTNVGTGLRASVMLHLPALAHTRRLKQVTQSATGAGFAVRGLQGEGSEAHGGLHQFSNQVTLGKTEEELVDELGAVCRQIAAAELEARRHVRQEQPLVLVDRVARAYAVLRHARSIDSEEALECLSWLRWGCDEQLITGLDLQTVNELLILIRPGVQQLLQTRRLPAGERDRLRAELLRRRLQSVEFHDRLTR